MPRTFVSYKEEYSEYKEYKDLSQLNVSFHFSFFLTCFWIHSTTYAYVHVTVQSIALHFAVMFRRSSSAVTLAQQPTLFIFESHLFNMLHH